MRVTRPDPSVVATGHPHAMSARPDPTAPDTDRNQGGLRRDQRTPSPWRASVPLIAVSSDAATTWLAVEAGAAEGHPLWSAVIGRMGIGPAMAIRFIVGLAIVVAVMVAIERDGTPITDSTLRVLTGVFAVVAAWNLGIWIDAAWNLGIWIAIA